MRAESILPRADNTSTSTYPLDGGGADAAASGCTTTVSMDGCTESYDCTQTSNGYTTHTKGTRTVNADGNGYTVSFNITSTLDATMEIALDCTFSETATRK